MNLITMDYILKSLMNEYDNLISEFKATIHNLKKERSEKKNILKVLKTLNQKVKRNVKRFPSDFMFEMTKENITEGRFFCYMLC